MIIELKQHTNCKKYTSKLLGKCFCVLLLIGVIGINANAHSATIYVAGTSIKKASSVEELLDKHFYKHFQKGIGCCINNH
jgi:hypothetical protein